MACQIRVCEELEWSGACTGVATNALCLHDLANLRLCEFNRASLGE